MSPYTPAEYEASRDRGDENVPTLPRGSGWHLSDRDLNDLDQLHAAILSWFSLATCSAAVRNISDVLGAFEAIAAGHDHDLGLELNLICRTDGADGISATVVIQPASIELSITEWIWMHGTGQGHDHAWRSVAELDPRGDFDHTSVGYWLHTCQWVDVEDPPARLMTWNVVSGLSSG